MARSNSAARLCALVNAQLAVDVADGRAESSMNVYLSPGAAPTEDGWEVYGRACPRRCLLQLKCHGSRLLPKATATTQMGLTLIPFSRSNATAAAYFPKPLQSLKWAYYTCSLFQLKCHGSRLLLKATAATEKGLALVPYFLTCQPFRPRSHLS